MAVSPTPNSRFRLTKPIITDTGVETYGSLNPHSFLDRANLSPDNILRTPPITAKYAGKLDILSKDIYGYTNLDWIFVLFNNIANPLGYPQINTIVEYPDPKIVLPLV